LRVELLMVGAHNGSKQKNAILGAASRGTVILIEPVPYLYDQLVQTFGSINNIHIEQICVAEKAGKVAFFAPSPGSNAVAPWGDQLGSMNRDHASLHHPAFAAYVSEIAVDCVTFKDLVMKYKIESIGTLFTDTEGFDSIILPTFPFSRVVPDNIVFEYKHSDGVFNIGRKFGTLICLLDKLGYNIRVVDMENCVASRRK
jgi:FkbM family methyltransferase